MCLTLSCCCFSLQLYDVRHPPRPHAAGQRLPPASFYRARLCAGRERSGARGTTAAAACSRLQQSAAVPWVASPAAGPSATVCGSWGLGWGTLTGASHKQQQQLRSGESIRPSTERSYPGSSRCPHHLPAACQYHTSYTPPPSFQCTSHSHTLTHSATTPSPGASMRRGKNSAIPGTTAAHRSHARTFQPRMPTYSHYYYDYRLLRRLLRLPLLLRRRRRLLLLAPTSPA